MQRQAWSREDERDTRGEDGHATGRCTSKPSTAGLPADSWKRRRESSSRAGGPGGRGLPETLIVQSNAPPLSRAPLDTFILDRTYIYGVLSCQAVGIILLYWFIFGCTGSWLLFAGVLEWWQLGSTLWLLWVGISLEWLLLLCGLGYRYAGSVLVALRRMVSSQTRDQTHVPCFGRRTLHHWITREVPVTGILSCPAVGTLLWPP